MVAFGSERSSADAPPPAAPPAGPASLSDMLACVRVLQGCDAVASPSRGEVLVSVFILVILQPRGRAEAGESIHPPTHPWLSSLSGPECSSSREEKRGTQQTAQRRGEGRQAGSKDDVGTASDLPEQGAGRAGKPVGRRRERECVRHAAAHTLSLATRQLNHHARTPTELVDIFCGEIDVCARFAGGNNAGHTIVVGKTKFDFHLLPSGVCSRDRDRDASGMGAS